MKRLPELISICFLIVGLLTSGTTENKSFEKTPAIESELQQEHDTSGLTGFLNAEPFNLTIIPPSSGVQFFKSGIVFLSNTKFEGKMLPKHVSFGSIEAYTAMVKDTTLGLHSLFSPYTSFSFPCEAITFSSDFKTMYFTMITKKEKKEKIYRAEYKTNDKGEAGWIPDENPLDFCSGNYIFTHPSLSADGNTMIFATDMPGSLGGLDLFTVKKTGEKWSKPENLGKSINTSRFECYPYFDQDNNLFFSSDGLAGYGGYDIFTCKFNGESCEKPLNH
ncbi:MAG: PD40 domain-containing protein [Bacteroidales bacterium]|nr:PD40 domain-containing protein [Bacteroidales bacterium]